MKLRVARHTLALKPITEYYTSIIGLSLLGEFKNHEGYDGVFLGVENENWHLEFTVSNTPPDHKPDSEDLLVFYPSTKNEFNQIAARLKANDALVEPENPYWQRNGLMTLDPDGYGIIIVNPKLQNR